MSDDQEMAQMMAAFARGLTVGPVDGDSAMAPSGEAYVTFALQIAAGPRDDNHPHDPKCELIAALGGVLEAYRRSCRGKYLRWRKRPTISDDKSGTLSIRCRVLISTEPASIFEIVREEVVTEIPEPRPRAPLHTPIPETCRPVLMIPWVKGYLGASGNFYDEFGKSMDQSPQTWRPTP